MGSLDKPSALRFITLLSGAVKGMAFYPASHPAIRQPLMELYKILTTTLGEEEQVTWGLIDGIMLFDDHLFIAPSAVITDMTNRMLEKKISRIVATSSISFEELESFAKLFSAKGVSFDVLSRQLAERGVTHLRLVRNGDENSSQTNDEPENDLGGDKIEMHNGALSAVKTICSDIENGRIPNSAPLLTVVDQMAGVTMREPWALLGLTMIKDYDNYTYTHCVNVGIISMALGATLGLDATSVRDLGIAGQLHDIGKTLISKDILNKPGKLSSVEFDEMKRHPELGSEIISKMEGLKPHIAPVVLGHHLYHDRSGYPEWASKRSFNQMIDIVTIADTYDAITTLRVYQPAYPHKVAISTMKKMTKTTLNEAVFERFVEMMGTYPVGTLVRLDTNEIALVYRPNPLDKNAPLVRILIDGKGKRLGAPREQALTGADGSLYARIVAVVDPLLKNIDIGSLISSGNY
ncbi:MAG: HD domain-containing phosphohydrolase [Desulfuromonadaceae bacterium]